MRRFIAIAGILALTATGVGAQRTIEVTGGAGYTSTDLEGFYGGTLNDWNQAWYGGHAVIVPFAMGPIGVGVEAGWQFLAWFDYQGLSGSVYRELTAFNVMGLVRVPLSDFFFSELTAGVFVFDEFTDPAIGAALGGRIPIALGWSIPVKLRTNLILDEDTNFVPIALEIGVGYDF
jgi:hypothetical protein